MKTVDIEICMGSSCFSRGNQENLEIIEDLSDKKTITSTIALKGCLCKQCCSSGPVIIINGIKHGEVHPSSIKGLLLSAMEEE